MFNTTSFLGKEKAHNSITKLMHRHQLAFNPTISNKLCSHSLHTLLNLKNNLGGADNINGSREFENDSHHSSVFPANLSVTSCCRGRSCSILANEVCSDRFIQAHCKGIQELKTSKVTDCITLGYLLGTSVAYAQAIDTLVPCPHDSERAIRPPVLKGLHDLEEQLARIMVLTVGFARVLPLA